MVTTSDVWRRIGEDVDDIGDNLLVVDYGASLSTVEYRTREFVGS
ncbi:hypothetical protein [Haloarcula nitratireducens]|nr:hypothetical protein [Halomicroarcula nitratireducens]